MLKRKDRPVFDHSTMNHYCITRIITCACVGVMIVAKSVRAIGHLNGMET